MLTVETFFIVFISVAYFNTNYLIVKKEKKHVFQIRSLCMRIGIRKNIFIIMFYIQTNFCFIIIITSNSSWELTLEEKIIKIGQLET